VNIRFTSTLTREDENVMAPAVIKTVASLLDLVPIAYVLRIDTSDGQVFEHSGPGAAGPAPVDVLPIASRHTPPFES
jgi:hypothetical protein